MTDTTPPIGGLDTVLQLTASLADQVLDAQIMDRPVPEAQVIALVKGADLLREHGVLWPPLLTQALHELARHPSMASTASEPEPERAAAPPPSDAISDIDMGGLARFFEGVRRGEGEALRLGKLRTYLRSS